MSQPLSNHDIDIGLKIRLKKFRFSIGILFVNFRYLSENFNI